MCANTPSSSSASGARPDDEAGDVPAVQIEKDLTAVGVTTSATASASNSRTEASDSALPLPNRAEMDSWSLAQLRAELKRVVIQKRLTPSPERAELEAQRLALIERVTRAERAEERKRDAARRVVIGRDVPPPPPDPVEKPWRKKRFGPNSRRSGPVDPPVKAKKDDEETNEGPDEELHSKRWKMKRKRELETAALEAENEELDTDLLDGAGEEARKKLRQGTES